MSDTTGRKANLALVVAGLCLALSACLPTIVSPAAPTPSSTLTFSLTPASGAPIPTPTPPGGIRSWSEIPVGFIPEMSRFFLQVGGSRRLNTIEGMLPDWQVAPEDASRARVDKDGTVHALAPGGVKVIESFDSRRAVALLAALPDLGATVSVFALPVMQSFNLLPNARPVLVSPEQGRSLVSSVRAENPGAAEGLVPEVDFEQQSLVVLAYRGGKGRGTPYVVGVSRNADPPVLDLVQTGFVMSDAVCGVFDPSDSIAFITLPRLDPRTVVHMRRLQECDSLDP